MPAYVYRCDSHGIREIRAAMGSAPDHPDCPGCAGPMRRVFTAPLLSRTPSGLARATDAAAATAETPRVVHRIGA